MPGLVSPQRTRLHLPHLLVLGSLVRPHHDYPSPKCHPQPLPALSNQKSNQLRAKYVEDRSLDTTSDGHLAVPRKRRKTDINTSVELQGSSPVSSSTRSRSLQSIPPLPTKATLNGVPQTPAAKISPGLLTDKAKGTTSPIRRIKLIVRAPEPVYTNPKQKPTLPVFNKSVTSALASFTRIEDEDVNEDALEGEARGRAVFLERVHALRQQGRMLLSAEDASRAVQTRPTVSRMPGADHGTTYLMPCAHVTAGSGKPVDPKSQLPSLPKCARTGICRMRKKAG